LSWLYVVWRENRSEISVLLIEQFIVMAQDSTRLIYQRLSLSIL